MRFATILGRLPNYVSRSSSRPGREDPEQKLNAKPRHQIQPPPTPRALAREGLPRSNRNSIPRASERSRKSNQTTIGKKIFGSFHFWSRFLRFHALVSSNSPLRATVAPWRVTVKREDCKSSGSSTPPITDCRSFEIEVLNSRTPGLDLDLNYGSRRCNTDAQFTAITSKSLYETKNAALENRMFDRDPKSPVYCKDHLGPPQMTLDKGAI